MSDTAKRIGYVDFNLANYHADTYLQIFRKELKARGYRVSGCWALMAREGKAWATKNQVPWFNSVEELDQAVDHYVVLAPSNPELHLRLCQAAFPMRKATYVDKTFAPDLKTAKAIYALAARYRIAVQTTSALRYTGVQEYVREAGAAKVRHVVAWGGGRSFAEYAIHPLEVAISCLGPGAERMMVRGKGDQRQILIDFSRGRTAVVNVYANSNTPFAASITTDKETRLISVDGSRLFVDAAAAMLDFFDSGKPDIDRRESLLIRKVLDVAETRAAGRRWVSLK